MSEIDAVDTLVEATLLDAVENDIDKVIDLVKDTIRLIQMGRDETKQEENLKKVLKILEGENDLDHCGFVNFAERSEGWDAAIAKTGESFKSFIEKKDGSD